MTAANGTGHNIEALHASGGALSGLTSRPPQFRGEIDSSRVPNDAWGLLGQAFFHSNYEELLDHLVDHVQEMDKALSGVADNVAGHAQTQSDNERRTADLFKQIEQTLSQAPKPPSVKGSDAVSSDPGSAGGMLASGGDMGKAAPGGSLIDSGGKFLKDLGSDATGQDIKHDVGGVLSDGVNGAGEVVSAASDPLGWLISKGVSFIIDIIKPLKDALEMVTGNPDAVGKAGGNFDKLGKDIEDLGKQFEQVVNKGYAESSGKATDAARDKLSHFRDGILGTANASGSISQLLQFTGMLMKAAEDFIKGLITDVIEFILMTQAAAAAAAVFTLGGSEAVAAGADAIKVAEESLKAEKKISEVTGLLQKVAAIWRKILAKFVARGKGNDALQAMDYAKGSTKMAKLGRATATESKKFAFKQGVKSTFGVDPTSRKGADVTQDVGGVMGKMGKLEQADDAGKRGQDMSDQDIDRNFDA